MIYECQKIKIKSPFFWWICSQWLDGTISIYRVRDLELPQPIFSPKNVRNLFFVSEFLKERKECRGPFFNIEYTRANTRCIISHKTKHIRKMITLRTPASHVYTTPTKNKICIKKKKDMRKYLYKRTEVIASVEWKYKIITNVSHWNTWQQYTKSF